MLRSKGLPRRKMHLTLTLPVHFFTYVGWLEYLTCHTVPYVHLIFQNIFRTDRDILPACIAISIHPQAKVAACLLVQTTDVTVLISARVLFILTVPYLSIQTAFRLSVFK